MATGTVPTEVERACEAIRHAWTVSSIQTQRDIQHMTLTHLSFVFQSSSGESNRGLYDQDFYAWTQTTAALIRAGTWDALDRETLAEEVDDLGVSQYDAVSSDLYQVLIHLLKWQYQPTRHVDSHSWRDSIVEHRDRIDRLCTRSPSLRTHLPAMLAEEYPRARRRASLQTSLPLATFPTRCPWTVEQVLDADFWPEGEPTA